MEEQLQNSWPANISAWRGLVHTVEKYLQIIPLKRWSNKLDRTDLIGLIERRGTLGTGFTSAGPN